MEYKEAADFLALILFPLVTHYEPKNVARFHPHSLWTRGKKHSRSIENTSGRCTARWQRVRQERHGRRTTTTEGTEETLAGFLLWSTTLNPPESSRGSGGQRLLWVRGERWRGGFTVNLRLHANNKAAEGWAWPTWTSTPLNPFFQPSRNRIQIWIPNSISLRCTL